MDIIDTGIKYRHNRYRCKKKDIKDIIDIGVKYRHNRYNRYRYKYRRNRYNRYRDKIQT